MRGNDDEALVPAGACPELRSGAGMTTRRGNGNQVRGGLTGKSGATGPPPTPASPREGEKREGTKALLRHELGFAKGAPCAHAGGVLISHMQYFTKYVNCGSITVL